MRVAALEQYVLFGAHHEEGQGERERMKPLEIDVAAVHHIESPSLYHQFVEDVNVMHLAIGNANEGGDVATQVEQCVHLHRTFVLTEPGPRKHRQTKINRCRIQRIQGLNEIHAERIVCIEWPGNGYQHLGKVCKDAPIVRLVGIAQCRARHASSEAHVVQLAAHRPQASFDVAETLAVCQLSKGHGQILIAARETPMVRISAITLDTLLELVGGQVIHELGEDSLSGIHPSLSAIRAGCSHSAPATRLCASHFKSKNASYTLSHLICMGYSGRLDFSRTLLSIYIYRPRPRQTPAAPFLPPRSKTTRTNSSPSLRIVRESFPILASGDLGA